MAISATRAALVPSCRGARSALGQFHRFHAAHASNMHETLPPGIGEWEAWLSPTSPVRSPMRRTPETATPQGWTVKEIPSTLGFLWTVGSDSTGWDRLSQRTGAPFPTRSLVEARTGRLSPRTASWRISDLRNSGGARSVLRRHQVRVGAVPSFPRRALLEHARGASAGIGQRESGTQLLRAAAPEQQRWVQRVRTDARYDRRHDHE
ncbi:hypothetical protein SEVIR_2G317001v4 [Setaria viridis]